jgi:hypothetical protein
MRMMYDAVTPANIPADAEIVGGYLNGRYAWSAADWARFPHAVHVRISVRAAFLDGHVLDVEPGDATPTESVGWVKARRAAGADPTVYCNRSTWPQVRAAFAAAGVAEPHYWIATASGRFEIPAGAVAAQYLLDTRGVDISAVADYWPGVDAPASNPGSTPAGPSIPAQEEDAMLVPAAADDYVSIPCNGATSLYISTAFKRKVKILAIVAVRDKDGTGTPKYTWSPSVPEQLAVIDPDIPGPIPIGPGCRAVQLRYSADHPFTAWCA